MLRKLGVLAIAGAVSACAGGEPRPSVSSLQSGVAPPPLETAAAQRRNVDVEIAPLAPPPAFAARPEDLARRLSVREELRRGAILEAAAAPAPRSDASAAGDRAAVTAALLEVELALGVGPRGPAAKEGVVRTAMLDEKEMDELRGGFAGLAFSVFFSGSVLNNNAQTGFLDVNTNGASPAPTGSFGTGDGNVRISASVGEFAGATGIFQIAQVPGNFNVVNNNLFVQIALVNLLEGSQLPPLQSLFGVR